jgi:hypothetical protein
MERTIDLNGFFPALRHIAGHAGITLLAVGIAFSLPVLANFILFTWWPMVARNSQLLLANELAFAAALVLLFNLLLNAREGQLGHRMNRMIALVYVRGEGSRFLRRAERSLLERIAGTRDVSVMSVTGFDTFVSETRKLLRVIDDCYELRVLLMNTYGPGALRRVQSLGDADARLQAYRRETEATLARLAALATAGKQVALKFYDEPPFWNLVVTGEYVWVQYCHDGRELRSQPEYVFALSRDKPAQGLFSAFYVHFLDCWNDPRHPEYDFAAGELVCRDEQGGVAKRTAYPPVRAETPAPQASGWQKPGAVL